jgi:hypothetical protein
MNTSRTQQPGRSAGSHLLGDTACVVAPALIFLHGDVGGVLFATDLCLLALLPIVAAKYGHLLRKRKIVMFCLLGIAWLAAQIVSDLVMGTPPDQYQRGWAKIFLTITHFTTIALLVRHSLRRLALYGIGLALGGALATFINPTDLARDFPWKFGLGIPVSMLACLLAALIAQKSRAAAGAVVFGMGILNFALGFRSLGTVCLAAAIFCQLRRRPKLAGGRTRKNSMTVTAVALALAGWAIVQGYSYSAAQGWLGRDAQLKYAFQSTGEGGLLLGGRYDIVAAAEAIIDSPVIGHGSWARDPKYQAMEEERRVAMGYKRDPNERETDLIPSHSYLLGAWVEAGFVGTAFWAWALWLTVKALVRAPGTVPLFPFFVFIAFLLAWCIAFSPYGADERFRATYFVYAMVMLNHLSQSRSPRRSYVHGIHRHYLLQSSNVSRAGHPVYFGAGLG